MKKVTLLGDSIRQIGYGTRVPELLGNDFEVFQPEDNCRFAKYTLRMLFDYRKQMEGSSVIHWNNGLWDICELFEDGAFTSYSEYEATMLRIADLLLKITPNVIFATTTPVRDNHPYNDNKLIAEYNAAIVPKLKQKGIIINDLFSLVYDRRNELIRPDDLIHLTAEGIELCAARVAEAIKEVAKNA